LAAGTLVVLLVRIEVPQRQLYVYRLHVWWTIALYVSKLTALGASVPTKTKNYYLARGTESPVPTRFGFALHFIATATVWVPEAGATMKQGNAPAVRLLRHRKT
jgi:hypothetical protein